MASSRVEEEPAGFNWSLLLALGLCIEFWVIVTIVVTSFVLHGRLL
jgi:hypothetical protein